jgi:anti-sigma factor RsiW
MTDDQDFVANKLQLHCADAVELVTDYLDNELNAYDLSAFEAHLGQCEGCTVFVDQIKMTVTLTRSANGGEVEILPRNFADLVAMLKERANHQA